MPIDMTNVIQIMHGGKEVVKIEDSNGGILWQKQSAITETITIMVPSNSSIYNSHTLVLPSLSSVKTLIASQAEISESSILSIDAISLSRGVQTHGGSTTANYRAYACAYDFGNMPTAISSIGSSANMKGTSGYNYSTLSINNALNYFSENSNVTLYGYYSISTVSGYYYKMSSSRNITTFTSYSSSATERNLILTVTYTYIP